MGCVASQERAADQEASDHEEKNQVNPKIAQTNNKSHFAFLSEVDPWVSSSINSEPNQTSPSLNSNQSNFIESIWNRCLKEGYPQKSLNCQFWQGMKTNSLNAHLFGKYNVQDIAYCFNAANAFEIGSIKADKLNETSLSKYLHLKYESNLKYATTIEHEWGVKPDGIILLKSTQIYVNFEDNTSKILSPYYLPVINYACYKLWPWIANQIIKTMNPNTNIYYQWVTGNVSQISTIGLEKEINKCYENDKIDKDIVYQIVCNALTCEANMFEQAINGAMHPLPFDISKNEEKK